MNIEYTLKIKLLNQELIFVTKYYYNIENQIKHFLDNYPKYIERFEITFKFTEEEEKKE